jgi:hypothetical protein
MDSCHLTSKAGLCIQPSPTSVKIYSVLLPSKIKTQLIADFDTTAAPLPSPPQFPSEPHVVLWAVPVTRGVDTRYFATGMLKSLNETRDLGIRNIRKSGHSPQNTA